jgi:hypothetical protein
VKPREAIIIAAVTRVQTLLCAFCAASAAPLAKRVAALELEVERAMVDDFHIAHGGAAGPAASTSTAGSEWDTGTSVRAVARCALRLMRHDLDAAARAAADAAAEARSPHSVGPVVPHALNHRRLATHPVPVHLMPTSGGNIMPSAAADKTQPQSAADDMAVLPAAAAWYIARTTPMQPGAASGAAAESGFDDARAASGGTDDDASYGDGSAEEKDPVVQAATALLTAIDRYRARPRVTQPHVNRPHAALQDARAHEAHRAAEREVLCRCLREAAWAVLAAQYRAEVAATIPAQATTPHVGAAALERSLLPALASVDASDISVPGIEGQFFARATDGDSITHGAVPVAHVLVAVLPPAPEVGPMVAVGAALAIPTSDASLSPKNVCGASISAAPKTVDDASPPPPASFHVPAKTMLEHEQNIREATRPIATAALDGDGLGNGAPHLSGLSRAEYVGSLSRNVEWLFNALHGQRVDNQRRYEAARAERLQREIEQRRSGGGGARWVSSSGAGAGAGGAFGGDLASMPRSLLAQIAAANSAASVSHPGSAATSDETYSRTSTTNVQHHQRDPEDAADGRGPMQQPEELSTLQAPPVEFITRAAAAAELDATEMRHRNLLKMAKDLFDTHREANAPPVANSRPQSQLTVRPSATATAAAAAPTFDGALVSVLHERSTRQAHVTAPPRAATPAAAGARLPRALPRMAAENSAVGDMFTMSAGPVGRPAPIPQHLIKAVEAATDAAAAKAAAASSEVEEKAKQAQKTRAANGAGSRADPRSSHDAFIQGAGVVNTAAAYMLLPAGVEFTHTRLQPALTERTPTAVRATRRAHSPRFFGDRSKSNRGAPGAPAASSSPSPARSPSATANEASDSGLNGSATGTSQSRPLTSFDTAAVVRPQAGESFFGHATQSASPRVVLLSQMGGAEVREDGTLWRRDATNTAPVIAEHLRSDPASPSRIAVIEQRRRARRRRKGLTPVFLSTTERDVHRRMMDERAALLQQQRAHAAALVAARRATDLALAGAEVESGSSGCDTDDEPEISAGHEAVTVVVRRPSSSDEFFLTAGGHQQQHGNPRRVSRKPRGSDAIEAPQSMLPAFRLPAVLRRAGTASGASPESHHQQNPRNRNPGHRARPRIIDISHVTRGAKDGESELNANAAAAAPPASSLIATTRLPTEPSGSVVEGVTVPPRPSTSAHFTAFVDGIHAKGKGRGIGGSSADSVHHPPSTSGAGAAAISIRNALTPEAAIGGTIDVSRLHTTAAARAPTYQFLVADGRVRLGGR